MRAMALPLAPPIKPQLAKSAKALPEGDHWRYEPKWDGFRTLVFKDGADVYLQSRGGKPMNRYFPDVVEQVASIPEERVVLDGEMVVEVDGAQEFDLLSQRIHPAESRVKMLAEQTPARYVAFDVLAVGDEVLTDLGYDDRRARLAGLDLGTVEESPSVTTTDEAGQWLTGTSEGVVAKEGGSHYLPGERKGMVKIKRLRTLDAVVAAFRYGKEEGTLGSLILGLYDDDGQLHVVGHTSGFKAKEKRELLDKLAPYMTGESGPGEPSRWKSDEDLVWEGMRPELVVEVSYDHVTGNRIRHGTRLLRWREDKAPAECKLEQLQS
jgi:ATP-dependent DNA ligase